MGQNYFNTLPLRRQLEELSQCRFMDSSEFNGVEALKDKKIVIIGCGSQGFHQGLNLRDSGLDVSYTLRDAAIKEKRQSWKNATENGFYVGTYEELIPKADLLINLTPDKQHTNVIESVMPLMKQDACLSYSHGFNIVEEGNLREQKSVKNINGDSECRHSLPFTRKMIQEGKEWSLQKPMLQAPVETVQAYFTLLLWLK